MAKAKPKQDKADNYLERLRNHKVVALLIVAGIAIIALGNVFDAFGKIGALFRSSEKTELKQTTISVAQLTINNEESYFTGSGQDTLTIKPDEYWQTMALALAVIDDTILPKAWPRLRYFMYGSKVSPLLEELAVADSAKKKAFSNKLNPVLDISFLNTGGATAVLTGIEFEVTSSEYISGADIVRPGALALPVLHRYTIIIPEMNFQRGDSTAVLSKAVLPPVEMRTNEAARIQVQFTHNRQKQYHYEGRLKFTFANAPPVVSGYLMMDM